MGSPSRVVVVGATGQVGRSLVMGLADGWEVVGTHHHRPSSGTVPTPSGGAAGWARLLAEVDASAVVVAAALTNVDRCDEDPALSRAVNVDLVAHVVAAAAVQRARVVHLSTDYVFDGTAGPYVEPDPTRPVNVYGHHKAESESLVVQAGGAVLRTSVVYGGNHNGAVDLVAERLRRGPSRFSPDHLNTPTWAADLVWLTQRVLREGYAGILHGAGPDTVSRYALAVAVARAAGLDNAWALRGAPAMGGSGAPRPVRCGLVVTRAQELLGYRPTPLAVGLSRHFG